MSEEKFTQGPWSAFYKRKYDKWHVSIPSGKDDGFNIALFPDGIDTDHPKGDACLIAAAPDMYEKLKALSGVLRKTVPLLADDIDSLLKKARGEK